MSDDEFYIGYQRTPTGLRRYMLMSVAVAAVGCAAVIAVLAAGQRDPGPGAWQTDDVQTVHGVLRVDPYLMVVTDTGQAILLTGPTKQGADAWANGLVGRRVSVRGHAVTRGELWLMSMADLPEPITVDGSTPLPPAVVPPAIHPAQPAEVFVGEIIDPKCYAGAMKPGDGKAHKSCAARAFEEAFLRSSPSLSRTGRHDFSSSPTATASR